MTQVLSTVKILSGLFERLDSRQNTHFPERTTSSCLLQPTFFLNRRFPFPFVVVKSFISISICVEKFFEWPRWGTQMWVKTTRNNFVVAVKTTVFRFRPQLCPRSLQLSTLRLIGRKCPLAVFGGSFSNQSTFMNIFSKCSEKVQNILYR